MAILIKAFRLTLLWALFILIICNANLGKVGHSPLFFAGFDKITHCGLFFVFVIFYASELIRKHKTDVLSYKYMLLVFAMAVLFGGLIEILQLTIFTWRSGEWNDFFADMIGISMGIFSVWKLNRAMYEKS